MIHQSSQLITSNNSNDTNNNNIATVQRLMSQRLFDEIADRFHGDVGIAQGIPYSIAALEDLIIVGCSDGSVRLYDDS